MTDILERLRGAHPHSAQYVAGSDLLAVAADEIAALRARNAEHEERYAALEAKEEYLRAERDRRDRADADVRLSEENDALIEENKILRAERDRMREAIKTIDAESIASSEPNYVAVPARVIAAAVACLNEQNASKDA